jgi:osmotically-inducible protein OsmY
MQYARIEMLLGGGGGLQGLRIAGPVGGQVRGAVINPADLSVTHTILSRKRAQHISSRAAVTAEPAHAPLPDGLQTVTGATRVRGPQGGVLGNVSRLWVAQTTGRITHVLMRKRSGLFSRGPERVVPVELLEAVPHGGLAAKIGPREFDELPRYRPDDAIEADVHLALAAVLADPRARRGVKTHMDDGHVLLAGEVDTIEQVRFAERAVLAIPGVRGLTVDLVALETLAAEVEARIAALGTPLQNGHSHIHVLTEHGIVYLEGSVSSADVRAQVERAALSAAGAKVVVNNLQVDGEPPDRAHGTGPLVRNR